MNGPRQPETDGPMRWRSKLTKSGLFALIAVAIIMAIAYERTAWFQGRAARRDPSAIEVFSSKLSGVFITAEGKVARILPDDLKHPRHQRFILLTDEGLSLLVAHNMDMAPRVDAEIGSRLRVRGEYIWNERGGVIHKTYPDIRGTRENGWIMVLK